MAGFGGNGPYDYSVQQPDVAGSLIGGIEAGQKLGLQRAAIDKHQQYVTDLNGYLQAPTAQSAAAMMAKYPESQKAMSASFDTYTQGQKEDIFKSGVQAYSAIQNGKPDVAMGIIDDRIKAAQNSGQDTTDLMSLKNSIQQNPQAASAGLGLTMSALNPDGWSKVATEMRSAQAAPAQNQKSAAEAEKASYEASNTPDRLALQNAQTQANIQNIDSQIGTRSQQLGLDRDKLQTETELKLNELGQKATTLDDGAKKLVNDSAIASVAADQSAGQMLDLASQLEKQGGGYGAFSTANEFLKSTTGNQDALSNMRREYMRLRNTQAIRNLPPGSASDADVAMAMSGFPEASADAKTLSSFLKGMAKLNQISAAGENAKSEWVNAVGHLGKPKKDIEIDGVKVPAGTPFTEFAKKYVNAKGAERGTQQSQQQVPNRSYMRFATPGAQ